MQLVVTHFCFGSESGDISSFLKTVEYHGKHKDPIDENIKKYIKTGVSYPKALSLSFRTLSILKIS